MTKIYSLLLFLLISVSLEAQVTAPYRVSYTDSLVLNGESHLLSTSIRISNISNKEIVIGMIIKTPGSWRAISQFDPGELSSIRLNPGENKAIPVNLLETTKVRAEWDSIIMKVWVVGGTDTNKYFTLVKAFEKATFVVQKLNEEQYFSDGKPDVISFKSRIKNTGNVFDVYSVSCKNSLLNIDFTESYRLAPGEDTLVVLNVRVKDAVWKQLFGETIQFRCEGLRAGVDIVYTFRISRPSSVTSQVGSLYQTFPLTIGGGILLNGSTISYYGVAHGNLFLGKSSLSFDYRSKELGPVVNTYQLHTVYINWSYRNLLVEIGRIRSPRDFYNNGQGVSVAYRKNKTGIYLAAIKHASNGIGLYYNNDNIFGGLNYALGKILISHNIITNFDYYYKINSYILNNSVTLLSKRNIALSVSGGIGYNVKADASIRLQNTMGYRAGYDFSAGFKKWHFTSNIDYSSKDFPGIFGGMDIQYHDVAYNFRKTYLNVFLSLNGMRRNILRDTLYNSDFLRSNSMKYGVGFGNHNRIFNYRFAVGIWDQIGQINNMRNAKFFDANLLWQTGKISQLSLSTNNCLSEADEDPLTRGTLFYSTNTYLSFQARHFRFSGGYNRFPITSIGTEAAKSVETVNGGPGANFSFFNHSLHTSFYYNVGKTLSEDRLRMGIGYQVSYSSNKLGLSVGLGGFYPLKDPTNATIPVTETQYGAFYINKSMQVPIRKLPLYTFKAILFQDDNSNGILDSNESPVVNAVVDLDNKSFRSDMNGEIMYKNVKPGTYSLGFVNSRTGSLIPSKGVLQKLELTGHTVLPVPFRTGKKLHGNLRIIADSLSSVSVTPQNFKILITDTFGREYSTFTDEKGDFYLYLLEGNYHVSLSEVFKSSDFKPDKAGYDVSLFGNEDINVQFVVRQKKRAIRFLDADKKK